MTTTTLQELNRATLARQMLLERHKVSVKTAVARLVGMQAQVPKPPFIGLWSRLTGFERKALLGSLERKELVRGTAMRVTLHVMTSEDFAATRPTLTPMLERAMRGVLRTRLDGVDLKGLAEKGARAFEKPQTFDAFRGQLPKKGDARAMAYAVRCLVPLVQVPTDAAWGFPGSADFMLAESWLGKPLGKGDANPRELVLRYLAAFGPATPGDMQTWSGLQALRETFEELRPKLKMLRDERGRELFDLPGAPRPPAKTPAPVRFIPEFDNLVLGHADRTRLIADEHKKHVFFPNLRVLATVLVDGRVAATWKMDRTKKHAVLTVEPFDSLPKKAKDEIAREGEALARFLEEDAEKHEVKIGKR